MYMHTSSTSDIARPSFKTSILNHDRFRKIKLTRKPLCVYVFVSGTNGETSEHPHFENLRFPEVPLDA
jgi:hypothetical protein